MGSSLRDFVAKTVAHYRPSLFLYKAEKASRDHVQVRETATFLEIIKRNEPKRIRISRGNAVYLVDMINSFDYYFNSAEAIMVREGGQTYALVDFSTPRYQMVDGFGDFPIMCPSLTEPYVTAQQYLDFAQIGAGDVVLDLGSYSGLTSIAFSKAVGASGRVVALEPDPANHAAAQINIAMHERLNGLSNITLLQAAVADQAGFLDLSSEGAMGSAIASAVGSYRGNVIRVESLSLMDIVQRLDLRRVDFIKMDIEGSEEMVLRGVPQFFAQFKPRIIVEPHIVDSRLSDKPVMQLLDGYGYECAIIEQIGVNLPLVTGVPRRH